MSENTTAVDVFLCRASGEGSQNFRLCEDVDAVFAFYKEMCGLDQDDTIDSIVKPFGDPDHWSCEGRAFSLELYCAQFEVWKVERSEMNLVSSHELPIIGLLRGVDSLLHRCLRHGLLRAECAAMLHDIDAVLKAAPQASATLSGERREGGPDTDWNREAAKPGHAGACGAAPEETPSSTERRFPICKDHKNSDWNQPQLEDDDCILCRLFYLEAQESLLEEWQQRAKRAEAAIEEIKRPLDEQMARLNETVTRLNGELARSATGAFIEAAKRFAAAHVHSDQLDKDYDERHAEELEPEHRAADREYNVSKKAMVDAYKAMNAIGGTAK